MLLGEPFTHLYRLSIKIKIGVENSYFFGLITPVKNLEGISADKLVVSINGNYDLILSTMLRTRNVDVFDCSNSDLVFDVSIMCWINAIEFEISTIGISTAVSGRIINYYYFVV